MWRAFVIEASFVATLRSTISFLGIYSLLSIVALRYTELTSRHPELVSGSPVVLALE